MTAAQALLLLRERWHIPLVAEPVTDPGAMLAPADIPGLLRALLDCMDARVAMAVALWLSLLEDVPPLPADWPQADRRRVGYLADVGRCLRLQRDEGELQWNIEAFCGVASQPWTDRLTLFPSPAPVLPASLLGLRWGMLEVVDAADYAGFQRLFLQARDARGTQA
jgi:hypothetical protein